LKTAREVKSGASMVCYILLGVEHGADRQEILGLREQGLKFDHGKLGAIRLHRDKNDMTRFQPMMPRTRETLREWLEHRT
jgi:hypothetical protein